MTARDDGVLYSIWDRADDNDEVNDRSACNPG